MSFEKMMAEMSPEEHENYLKQYPPKSRAAEFSGASRGNTTNYETMAGGLALGVPFVLFAGCLAGMVAICGNDMLGGEIPLTPVQKAVFLAQGLEEMRAQSLNGGGQVFYDRIHHKAFVYNKPIGESDMVVADAHKPGVILNRYIQHDPQNIQYIFHPSKDLPSGRATMGQPALPGKSWNTTTVLDTDKGEACASDSWNGVKYASCVAFEKVSNPRDATAIRLVQEQQQSLKAPAPTPMP
jgi:hypothetical protein